MGDENINKTALNNENGHYEFGLKNDPATFQYIMEILLLIKNITSANDTVIYRTSL